MTGCGAKPAPSLRAVKYRHYERTANYPGIVLRGTGPGIIQLFGNCQNYRRAHQGEVGLSRGTKADSMSENGERGYQLHAKL